MASELLPNDISIVKIRKASGWGQGAAACIVTCVTLVQPSGCMVEWYVFSPTDRCFLSGFYHLDFGTLPDALQIIERDAKHTASAALREKVGGPFDVQFDEETTDSNVGSRLLRGIYRTRLFDDEIAKIAAESKAHPLTDLIEDLVGED